jgi:hypothetical protein
LISVSPKVAFSKVEKQDKVRDFGEIITGGGSYWPSAIGYWLSAIG